MKIGINIYNFFVNKLYMSEKRHFTIVEGKKEHGLFVGRSPSSVAKKVVSKLSKGKKVTFYLREITQGSKKKVYGPYEGIKKKLAKPVKVGDRVYKYESIVKKVEKKGGLLGIGLGKDGYFVFYFGANNKSKIEIWKQGKTGFGSNTNQSLFRLKASNIPYPIDTEFLTADYLRYHFDKMVDNYTIDKKDLTKMRSKMWAEDKKLWRKIIGEEDNQGRLEGGIIGDILLGIQETEEII